MVNTAQIRKVNKATNAFTLIEIMIVVLIIGILLAIAVPNFVRAREASRAKSCVANLKTIDSAVEQWAMTYNIPATWTSPVVIVDLANPSLWGGQSFLKTIPICPSGGTYPNPLLNAKPTCSVGGTPGDALAHALL